MKKKNIAIITFSINTTNYAETLSFRIKCLAGLCCTKKTIWLCLTPPWGERFKLVRVWSLCGIWVHCKCFRVRYLKILTSTDSNLRVLTFWTQNFDLQMSFFTVMETSSYKKDLFSLLSATYFSNFKGTSPFITVWILWTKIIYNHVS